MCLEITFIDKRQDYSIRFLSIARNDRLFSVKTFAVHAHNYNNDLLYGNRMTEFKLSISTCTNVVLHLFRNVVGCSAILI
jgi:hypothetical protein